MDTKHTMELDQRELLELAILHANEWYSTDRQLAYSGASMGDLAEQDRTTHRANEFIERLDAEHKTDFEGWVAEVRATFSPIQHFRIADHTMELDQPELLELAILHATECLHQWEINKFEEEETKNRASE